METTNVKRYRYFLYSKTQHNMRTEVDKKINKTFIPGKVLNRGRWHMFTEISSTPVNRFPDSKIVAEGNLEDIKYQNHSSVWGAQ